MRKILSTLMTCCLVLLSSSTAVLADGNTNVNDGNNVVFIDSDGPALYYNPNIESEARYTLPNRYDQNDYLDSLGVCLSKYNLERTIKNAGCALTSLAMVRDYYKGTPYQDPAQLNASFMIPQGLCDMDWDLLGVIGLRKVYREVRTFSYSLNNMTEFAEIVASYLDEEQLVIAQLGPSSHFIVINGYEKLVPDAGGGYAIYVTNSGYTDLYSLYQALNSNWSNITSYIVIDEA